MNFYREPESEPIVVQSPPMRAVRAERATFGLITQAAGTVALNTEAQLVPEISGSTVEMLPTGYAGGSFEESDVLLKIDGRESVLAKPVLARPTGASSSLFRRSLTARHGAIGFSTVSASRLAASHKRASAQTNVKGPGRPWRTTRHPAS